MAVTADILRRLGRLRLEPEALEEVMSIIADLHSVEEERRAVQRDRTARHRAMRRDCNVTVTTRSQHSPVTVENGEENQGPTVFPSEEVTPPSPPEGGSVTPQKKRLKPTGTLCPEDLKPTESHYLKCDQRGVPRSLADRACESLINWSHERADQDIAWKADWLRALHRWLDKDISDFRPEGGAAVAARARGSPRRNGSGNGFYDLLRDEMDTPDDQHSAPRSDQLRLIAGSRH